MAGYFRDHPETGNLPFLKVLFSDCSVRSFTAVYFHAARIIGDPAERFSSGILPLHQRLDQIWDELQALLGADYDPGDWQEFRGAIAAELRGGFQYRLKTGSDVHRGPYGLLIRETQLRSSACGSHDYLGQPPEIVDDICSGFETISKIDLRSRYVASSQPCIVKFVSRRSDHWLLNIAIEYLQHSLQGLEVDGNLLSSFDGKGFPVPPTQILEIQTGPKPTPRIKRRIPKGGRTRWSAST